MDDIVTFFFHMKWPNGFSCPQCGCKEYYTIRSRRLPLYQCKICKHQTTITCGTLMEKSRTPLDKWAAAIELLSNTNGINALQLSRAISISHTTAWRIMHKIRSAISAIESARQLNGSVQAGTASSSRWRFRLPPIGRSRHKQEHVVIVGATIVAGKPRMLKMTTAPDQDLYYKSLTREGEINYIHQHISPSAHISMLKRVDMACHKLTECFYEAERWLNRLFHGVSSTYFQAYLYEYCFRWNAAKEDKYIRDDLFKMCTSNQLPPLLSKRNAALRARETHTTLPVAV